MKRKFQLFLLAICCGFFVKAQTINQFTPSEIGQDNNGKHINAHGGDTLFDKGVELMTVVMKEDLSPIYHNPGKGWVFYGTRLSDLTPEQIGLGSVCYDRYNWADLEPSEGTYDWKRIEGAITRAHAAGLKYAFGVMNAAWCYTSQKSGYSTPKWVFDKGARSYRVAEPDKGPLNIMPRWDDNPVFFTALSNFVKALAARYDGHPDLAWIDLRAYGDYGEGHLGYIDKDLDGTPVKYIGSDELISNYYKPYQEAFTETQLIIPYGSRDHLPAYKWAVAKGIGMRRDGIPDWSDGKDIGQFGESPINVVEYSEDYRSLLRKDVWKDDVVAQAVLNARASYAEISRGGAKDFLSNASSYMKAITNHLGYHFVLESVTLPSAISIGLPFEILMQWSNKGVASLSGDGCYLAIALLDQSNQVVDVSWLDGIDPKTWKPGSIKESSKATFAKAPAGNYKHAIGLFTNKTNTQPDYRIGNAGRTAEGWYILTDSGNLVDR